MEGPQCEAAVGIGFSKMKDDDLAEFATFQYSTDGKEWHSIGRPFQMRFDYTRLFMGTRYAIFNYATRKTGGNIDIDYFTYNKTKK